MFGAVNQARQSNGLPALSFDWDIQSVAVNWSSAMARDQHLAHNPSYVSQIASVLPNWVKVAENVGRGPTSEAISVALMASPTHRHNILNPAYTHVTVGCVRDVSGHLWITQNFRV